MTESRSYLSEDLSDLAAIGDNDIPLANSALRIALPEYPGLDSRRWLDELDTLAKRVADRASGRGESALLDALDTVLFVEEGFHGNAVNYFDPRNSFLNDVLESRTGIPITLSVIYIEVGRRVGLQLAGVGFPGHFLVGHVSANEFVCIDPFNGGTRLTRDDCVALLAANGGKPDLFDDAYLEPVTHRQILLRMLANLKLIYLRASDYARAISAIDRILQLAPSFETERRDRGLIQLQAGNPGLALRDLEQYLDSGLGGDDLDTVRKAIAVARQSLAQLN